LLLLWLWLLILLLLLLFLWLLFLLNQTWHILYILRSFCFFLTSLRILNFYPVILSYSRFDFTLVKFYLFYHLLNWFVCDFYLLLIIFDFFNFSSRHFRFLLLFVSFLSLFILHLLNFLYLLNILLFAIFCLLLFDDNFLFYRLYFFYDFRLYNFL